MDELADLKKRFERLKLLYDVSNTIHSSLDAQETLQLIVGEAVRLTQASSGSVALIDPTANVINIEASHGYPQFPRFIAEVTRVLRPGGHFLYADLRPRYRIAEWEAALADAPMRLISHTVINAQVLRGMEKNSQRLISRHMPAFLHGGMGRELLGIATTGQSDAVRLAGSAREFAGGQASRVYRALQSGEVSWLYRALQSGEMSYRMYCFARD